MALSILDRLLIIYERSNLSISRFAQIIGKDRRTLTSWIDKNVNKEPSNEVLRLISQHFRYSERIWDKDCSDDEFFFLLTQIPKSEIRVIDEGYEGSLEYILDKESKRRFVIHPRFPSPAYRDKIVAFPYKFGHSPRATHLRQMRYELMLEHGFESIEWYSIESLLRFAFSPIGNIYTIKERLAVLELMIENFEDNYNKSLYLFDSYSTKIFGVDMTYLSLNPQEDLMFIKLPIDSMIVEIRNKMLVHRIHKHFTSRLHAPKHIPKDFAPQILKMCAECLGSQKDIMHFCTILAENTPYAPLFMSSISTEFHHLLFVK
ncbi:MAG: hypothetical protein J1E28_01680 [Helicobacter sp.]|uniref:hypothetical protein n=1 Tax=Helicobacter sp. TaxID=218 RepID=UPI0025C3E669|nr:hypothetical protein [Helicobacter sp.]MCH5313097.1 hypothetical protein [Helicobacter sp.]